jgi:hypothetical protein
LVVAILLIAAGIGGWFLFGRDTNDQSKLIVTEEKAAPQPTPTTQPTPQTQDPAGSIEGGIQLITPTPGAIWKGTATAIFGVRASGAFDSLSTFGGPKRYTTGCECLGTLSMTTGRALALLEGDSSNGRWGVSIYLTDLPVGRYDMHLNGRYRDGPRIPWDEYADFSFEILPNPLATESDGPELTLLSVSPTYVATGSDEITVRWQVSDASGIRKTTNQLNRDTYASRFRSLCTRPSHTGVSLLYSGQPSSTASLITDDIFEATFSWGASAPYVYDSSCSIEFLTYDKWGNWTRNTFADQYTTAPEMK